MPGKTGQEMTQVALGVLERWVVAEADLIAERLGVPEQVFDAATRQWSPSREEIPALDDLDPEAEFAAMLELGKRLVGERSADGLLELRLGLELVASDVAMLSELLLEIAEPGTRAENVRAQAMMKDVMERANAQTVAPERVFPPAGSDGN
jgi:hypothetical protein